MADNNIATDGSSPEDGVKDHRYYLYQIQKMMAELSEKYKDQLLASKAAKEKKRIPEKIIIDVPVMAGNVKLEKGAESTVSDFKGDGNNASDDFETISNIFEEFYDKLYGMAPGNITEKVKDVKGDVNVKERTTPIESDSDAKGSATGEKVGATMAAFKKTDEKEPEKGSLAGVAEPFKEGERKLISNSTI